MFLLRSVIMDDMSDILKLSQLGVFISLPKNQEVLKKLIQNSISSFKKPNPILHKNNYMFVLEDLEANEVIGVSVIHAQHGTEHEPHFFLRVTQEHKFSKTLNTGFVHGILKLGIETNGPTEIGGLVLQSSYRNHPEKLGKQLSFVRFLYMSIFPERFKEEVHSELLPPFDEKGNSPLWEAIGRRFMNMDYHEADLLSRQNKEFILSLFPSGTIYITLLPMQARNSIGKVGAQTLPVKTMLESIGFKYIDEVDPFDGGPHYRCSLKNITPIKSMEAGKIRFQKNIDENSSKNALISISHPKYDFAAFMGKVNVIKEADNSNSFTLNSQIQNQLPISEGQETKLIYINI